MFTAVNRCYVRQYEPEAEHLLARLERTLCGKLGIKIELNVRHEDVLFGERDILRSMSDFLRTREVYQTA